MKSDLLNPDIWVEQYGNSLYGYAFSRVQDPNVAEDLVQETFLAAIKAQESFKGRSSEKTWLTAILKHKIIDYIRKKSAEQPFDDIESIQKSMDDFFDASGKWKTGPAKWLLDPEELYDQKEFWRVFLKCLSGISSRLSHVFTLREMEGLSTEEICKVLNISSTNVWVMLHRARMFLRHCIQTKWFEIDKKGVAG